MAPINPNKQHKKQRIFNQKQKSQKKDNKNFANKQKKMAELKHKEEGFQDEVESNVEEKPQQQIKKQASVEKVGQKKISKQKQDQKAKLQNKKDNNKQAVSKQDNKKQKDQKIKKQKEKEQSDDEDSSDIEIEDEELFDQEALENQNEMLGNLAQMKKSSTKKSKKEKERKVTEFKFRVLDMLEIFIKKTKNPQIFIQSLAQLFQTVKDNANDKEKQSFVEKICQIVRKFFERHVKMLPEYRDNIEECFTEVVKVLAKQPKKSINSALTFAAISLFKIRLQMNLGDISVLVSTIEKALEKSALKKEISYSEEFYKEIIRNSQEIAFKLLPSLLKYALLNKDGGAKDKNRQFILSILNYTIRNSQVQELIKKDSADFVASISNLISVFDSQSEIQKKKISVLNKYIEIFAGFASILKDCKTNKKEELQNKLKESLSKWPENDHNLKNIQKKFLEKFTF
ncbi:hypothetical protein TTHERM_01100440 (macronuclear) [Tetrahymena thermophila SB210]|uniref:Uncharacterized protein n=1 Tax=Tetrahymena thermophila (strain SB210) TaxID=312017 RepID=Q22BG8_TETTS|nr:hypothetical protein TTHERM_01100440 [Tetrahymena thermophila SB210]EAR82636.1 hypothetical protein TTHERM_01100440 [Tetrahymena thermophila SB210]|eukprot:XP_001030299.1 hypothetical protein TTHERM_01100440 [Tetrahymena thermophila SB210]